VNALADVFYQIIANSSDEDDKIKTLFKCPRIKTWREQTENGITLIQTGTYTGRELRERRETYGI